MPRPRKPDTARRVSAEHRRAFQGELRKLMKKYGIDNISSFPATAIMMAYDSDGMGMFQFSTVSIDNTEDEMYPYGL